MGVGKKGFSPGLPFIFGKQRWTKPSQNSYRVTFEENRKLCVDKWLSIILPLYRASVD